MKTRLFLIVVLAVLTTSCTKEYHNEYNEYYENTEEDFKTKQILATLSLYENIARQPEMQDKLVAITEQLAGYSQISELAPLNDQAIIQRGNARGECLGACFLAIARQPEIHDDLVTIAKQFLGTYGDGIITEEINNYSRLKAIPSINEACARQPELCNLLPAFSKLFFGKEIQYKK